MNQLERDPNNLIVIPPTNGFLLQVSSAHKCIQSRQTMAAMNQVIRHPNRFTAAKPGEFPITIKDSPKISGHEVAYVSNIKAGNDDDVDGKGTDCPFYCKVIYKQEMDRCYDENAIIFCKIWNDELDIINKWDSTIKHGLQRRTFNQFIKLITSFDQHQVCLLFFFYAKKNVKNVYLLQTHNLYRAYVCCIVLIEFTNR